MLLLLSLPVYAQEVEARGPLATASTSGTFDLDVRYYRDDTTLADFPEEDHLFDYVETVSRTNLLADGAAWQVGAQVDHVAMFGAKYYLDDELQYEFGLHGEGVDFPLPMAYANLEKVWLVGRASWGQVQLGDGYASFGRGLALNLVRNTDIDVDTSLRGAKATATLGRWDLQLISGLTNQQQVLQDNPNRQLRANRNHMVTGARVEGYGLGPLNLGAHAVAVQLARDLDEATPYVRYQEPWTSADGLDVLVGGATAEFYAGGVDWFFEGDGYRYGSKDFFAGEDPVPGYAGYASASFYPGPLAVLIEAKRYKNTELVNAFTTADGYELMVGPSLEYENVITEDSSAAVNSNDIWGARARVNLSLKKGAIIPFVALGAYRDNELGGLHFNRAPETIFHPLIGVDLQGDTQKLILNTGVRVDVRDDGYGQDTLAHLDATWAFPVGPVHGEVIWNGYQFQWGDNANQQEDFYTSSLSLAAQTHRWTFVAYNDITNDPLVDSTGNITDQVYLAGEVQYQPNDRTTLKAFYGAYKAGIRCAGGQCKRLPGFEGARATATVTF
jgi:hypothetical protein